MTELEKKLFDVIDLLKGQLKVVDESKVIAGKPDKPRISPYDCQDCKVTCDKSFVGGGTSFRMPSGLYLCDSCETKRDDLYHCSDCKKEGCTFSNPHHTYLCGDCFVKREQL